MKLWRINCFDVRLSDEASDEPNPWLYDTSQEAVIKKAREWVLEAHKHHDETIHGTFTPVEIIVEHIELAKFYRRDQQIMAILNGKGWIKEWLHKETIVIAKSGRIIARVRTENAA